MIKLKYCNEGEDEMAIGKRLTIKKVTPGYWRATLSNPPINLYDPELFAELRVLMDQIEADQDLKVIVFDSADLDYFIAHYDTVTGYNIPDIPKKYGRINRAIADAELDGFVENIARRIASFDRAPLELTWLLAAIEHAPPRRVEKKRSVASREGAKDGEGHPL
jgi:enoyl-CoA hydratase/carnithine racemase